MRACPHCGRQFDHQNATTSCQACDAAVSTVAKFCDQCGAPLTKNCESCQGANRLKAIFCQHCGDALAVDPSEETSAQASEQADAGDETESLDELLRHHLESLNTYVAMWFDDDMRAEAECSLPEIAYYLCLHAASLWRYSDNNLAMKGLLEFEMMQRVRIVRAATDFLRGLSLHQKAEPLLEEDLLETEDLEQLDDLLLVRDGAEEVLQTLKSLAADFSSNHQQSVRPGLAEVICEISRFDDLLLDRPDVVSVLGEPLDALATMIAPEKKRKRAWWFETPAMLRRQAQTLPLPTSSYQSQMRSTSNAPSLADQAAQFVATQPETYSLQASTFATGSSSFYLSSEAPVRVRALLILVRQGIYQLKILSPETMRLSNEWDGDWAVAVANGEEVSRQKIHEGAVLFKLSNELQSIFLEKHDGVQAQLTVEEEDPDSPQLIDEEE